MQGLCRDRAGIVQGLYRDYAGIVQGLCRDRAGIVQGSYRDCEGIVQGYRRDRVGIVQGLCVYRWICCFGIVLNFQCRDCVFRIVCVSMDLLFWRTIIPCNDSCGIVNYANVFTFSSGLVVVVVMRNL